LDATNRLIRARRITTRTVKERARHVLEFIKQCAKGAPDIIGGDKPEISKVSEEMNTLMTSAATQSIVLLKNQDSILPLDTAKIKNLAIVGSNAKDKVLSGGGSAAVKPTFFISPYDGLVQALPGDVQVTFAEGIRTWRTTPTLEDELTIPNGQEKRGWKATWYPHESDDSMVPLPDPLFAQYIDETRVFISVDGTPPGITKRYTLVLEGNLKSRPVDTSFEFGLSSAGRAKLYVNDELAVDNWTRQRRGKSFFGNGSLEDTGVVTLKKDYENAIRVVYCNVRAPADGDENEAVMDWGAG
jgi:beta-glucosidase